MALQDLTPQLRTRLNRTEKAAGWFVLLAILLLLFGLSYYLYQTAKNRGWGIPKITYHTGVNDTTGLKVGDQVRLMGYAAGHITKIDPNAPSAYYGVTVYFNIEKPHYGYIWSDSEVKISADLFNNRFLEVTKGKRGVPTVDETTNKVAVGILKHKYARQQLAELLKQSSNDLDVAYSELNAAAKADKNAFYDPLTDHSACWLSPAEAPSLSDRADKLVSQVEAALPNILALTNTITRVLVNSADLTSNLNAMSVELRPAVSNLASLSGELRGPGALGAWVLGDTNLSNLGSALNTANLTLTHTDTNLAALFESVDTTINNLANITSNLNAQVQANSNMLGSISKIVVDTDDLVQGLKHHWLLRSAFKKENKANTK